MAFSLHPSADVPTGANPLTALARPFIKWAGGKSRLIEQYKPFLPVDYDRYHEPFLGGGALFFYLAPQLQRQGKKAYLSDLNPELVNVYQCVRDHVEPLIEKLADHQQRHGEAHYYSVRSQLETDPILRAARFIYLNKTCYNGLYRENSKGLFNVPIGRYKNPRICAPELLRPASAALQVATIAERPFISVADYATGPKDFVYFDPPYHPLSDTSKFTAYSRYRFAAEQQIELKNLIQQLSDRQVTVLASNSDCPFIRELYAPFTVKTITAARSINSKASKRGKITEVLITA
ncbi:MAG: DNA adenine methylase [Cyanobacteria bacterium J06623_4]